MKVLLTLYGDEALKDLDTPEGHERNLRAWGEFYAAAEAAGVLVLCEPLEAAHTSTTVRVGGGRRQITDGPFMETKEQLGGILVLRVQDLDEALAWAERTPWNHDGCATEIRPIVDYEATAARLGEAGAS
jgi:hypothetical protein